ncbi:hypothetical protein ABEB36_010940 [Hypothenemus hampei]|uniref:Uncharacterized protein n=1 Tax=Hypothenemus hampei TaxID=57062 RepID=A0ABD1EDK3_HYPHA
MQLWTTCIGITCLFLNLSTQQWLQEPSQWFQLAPSSYHQYRRSTDEGQSGRHFKPETIFKITETLGALNTVGRYLVNMTRTGETAQVSEEVPNALYTISKNVLGRNVTDTIAPLVREALPLEASEKVGDEEEDDDEGDSKSCTTPEGLQGNCNDLSDCPQLLLNLGNLRQSLCFKSLFVPGVCCPKSNVIEQTTVGSTTQRATTTTTTTQTSPVTFASIYYNTDVPSTTLSSLSNSVVLGVSNYVDSEDCGQPESAKFRVVGGEEALSGRWPWMAAIFLHGSKRTEFWCGGSLISSTHILTAAHCTRDSRQRPFLARQFTVRLGDIDLKREDEPSAPVTFKVQDIKAHKQFSRS